MLGVLMLMPDILECSEVHFLLTLLERKDVIHKEIPECNHSRCNQLDEVEVPLSSAVQQVNHKVVDGQTHQREAHKPEILHHNMWVVAGECPHTVEYVVRCGGASKSYRIGHILIELEKLFGEVGDAEIDHHTRAANYAEFQESLYESLVL